MLTIEISVLGTMEPIHPDDVEVGRHGLMIVCGHQRGILLPQVPIDQGWDREMFLAGLCQKGGLPTGAWELPDAEMLAFEAVYWGEEVLAERQLGKE